MPEEVSYFNDLLTEGQPVELRTAFSPKPFSAQWLAADAQYIRLRMHDGRTMILPVGQLVSVVYGTPEVRTKAPSLPPLRDAYPDAEMMKSQVDAPQVRVVGRIDLPGSQRPEIPEGVDASVLDIALQPNGRLKSIGNIYGYISRYDTGEDLFFYTNQLRYRQGERPVQPGEELVFTLGQNKKGSVAYTIHRPCTVGEALELMDSLDPSVQYMDVNNFNSQISGAATDDDTAEALARVLESRQVRRRKPAGAHNGLRGAASHLRDVDVDQVLTSVASDEDMDTRTIQDAEKKAFVDMDPEEYRQVADRLLTYAIRHNEQPYYPGLIYQLFTRIIKNLDPAQARAYVDAACAYYEGRGEERPTQYFNALKERLDTAEALSE